MKRKFIILTASLFSMGMMNLVYGQTTAEILNWYNTKTPGMNTEKAYKSLKKKKSTTVVVAIIDSGVDIEHKDLKGKIWVNSDEIANNGIDDDKNGYIDDVHGWNFLGGSDGKNQGPARLEKTRIISQLHSKYKDAQRADLTNEDRMEYDKYKRMYEELQKERTETEGVIEQYAMISEMIPEIKNTLEEKFGKNYTVDQVKSWNAKGEDEMRMKQIGMAMASGQLTEEALKEGLESLQSTLNYHLNLDYNDRGAIGDDPHNLNDTNYGNNDVEGPDALHGTHVGGIVGAIRGNDLGGDGVANDVLLMSIRTVPDGDEQDKDVALAIRYAVDNGASVVNMSFGKAFSMHPEAVFEAMKYAETKGVLLVHAAGNDGHSLDKNPNFPTNEYEFQKGKLTNYLCIGASTRYLKEGKLAAAFSNFSPTQVDVFAPGFEIYNTVPQSEYKKLQGTSMAAPMVTGVAAMLKSYYPKLNMIEIKDIMLKSAKSYKGKMIEAPGTGEMVDFGGLSVTGGVVDIVAASKMCKVLEATK